MEGYRAKSRATGHRVLMRFSRLHRVLFGGDYNYGCIGGIDVIIQILMLLRASCHLLPCLEMSTCQKVMCIEYFEIAINILNTDQTRLWQSINQSINQ